MPIAIEMLPNSEAGAGRVEIVERKGLGFRENMHAFDPATGMRCHSLVQPGSADLVDIFMRQRHMGTLVANDTSCGVGYAPLSDLERVVLAVERGLNMSEFKS